MKILLFILLFLFIFSSCSSGKGKFYLGLNNTLKPNEKEQYIIKNTGIINCFEEGKKTKFVKNNKENEILASCELSAVVFNNNNLFFANDKSIYDNNVSPIFSIPFNNNNFTDINNITYYKNSKFIFTKKFEDLTVTLDNKYIFATTSFDRDDSNYEYNSILYWQPEFPNNVEFLSVIENEKETRDIKKYLQKELNNSKYFKVEGLTIIPDNKILFGIREEGDSYKNFEYSFKIILASLIYKDSKYFLKNDFKLIYNFKNTNKYINEKVGLSGLAWNKFNDKLFILSSFEHENIIGAYLWTIDLERLYKNNDPILVHDSKNIPLKFNNKAEGITILNNNELFIINDDDRIIKQTKINGIDYFKKPNESIYNILSKSL